MLGDHIFFLRIQTAEFDHIDAILRTGNEPSKTAHLPSRTNYRD